MIKTDRQILSEHAQDVAVLLKQLANKYRLMILCCLVDNELSVSEINEQINLSQSALSQHLAKLRENKLVSTRRESQTIYYSVENPQLQALLKALYENYCGENKHDEK